MIDFEILAKSLPHERVDWQSYFFAVALMVSARSDCTRRRFGCVAVSPDKRIIATGYNAPPSGIRSKVQEFIRTETIKLGVNPDDDFSISAYKDKIATIKLPPDFQCCKEDSEPHGHSYNKCYANHGEFNCLTQIGSNNNYKYIKLYIAGRDGKTGELLDGVEPCIHCSRLIRSFNVEEVFCLNKSEITRFTPSMLKITT